MELIKQIQINIDYILKLIKKYHEDHIKDKEISNKITMLKNITDWSNFVKGAFIEFERIVKPDGWIAFEVGEIRNGTVNLDEIVVPLGKEVGLDCEGIIVNLQNFTKTSSIWGVKNNHKGTNTNRIVLFRKPSNG